YFFVGKFKIDLVKAAVCSLSLNIIVIRQFLKKKQRIIFKVKFTANSVVLFDCREIAVISTYLNDLFGKFKDFVELFYPPAIKLLEYSYLGITVFQFLYSR